MDNHYKKEHKKKKTQKILHPIYEQSDEPNTDMMIKEYQKNATKCLKLMRKFWINKDYPIISTKKL